MGLGRASDKDSRLNAKFPNMTSVNLLNSQFGRVGEDVPDLLKSTTSVNTGSSDETERRFISRMFVMSDPPVNTRDGELTGQQRIEEVFRRVQSRLGGSR